MQVIDPELPAVHRHAKDHGAPRRIKRHTKDQVGRAFGSRRHEESGLAHDAEGQGGNHREAESVPGGKLWKNLALKHFGNPQAQSAEEGRRRDGDVDAPRAILRRHRGDTPPHPRAKV